MGTLLDDVDDFKEKNNQMNHRDKINLVKWCHKNGYIWDDITDEQAELVLREFEESCNLKRENGKE